MCRYSREELINKLDSKMLGAEESWRRPAALADDDAERRRQGERCARVPRRNKARQLHGTRGIAQGATIVCKRRLLAIVRDITERKRAEDAIRASEEQYRAIFNASEDALVLWDSTLSASTSTRLRAHLRLVARRGDRERFPAASAAAEYTERRWSWCAARSPARRATSRSSRYARTASASTPICATSRSATAASRMCSRSCAT